MQYSAPKRQDIEAELYLQFVVCVFQLKTGVVNNFLHDDPAQESESLFTIETCLLIAPRLEVVDRENVLERPAIGQA